MAFRDFTFEDVQEKFSLILTERDLFRTVQPIQVATDFAERIQVGTNLALALSTEKARSEFIIAPILLEVWRLFEGKFGLFSGIEFNVDASRGLNGFCDYLLTRSPLQLLLKAPIVAVVEAKNDNIRSGLGQCVAAMIAAREFNAQSTPPIIGAVFGLVTTGSSWRFLKLEENALFADSREYLVDGLGQIMGILAHILTQPS